MRLLRLLAILAWFPTLFGQPLDSDRPVGQKGDESIVREQSREQVEDIDPRLEGWTPEKQPNPNNYPRSAQEWVGYGVPGALLLRYMAHVSHWDFVECLKMARTVKERHLRERHISQCCGFEPPALGIFDERCATKADKIFAQWDKEDEENARQAEIPGRSNGLTSTDPEQTQNRNDDPPNQFSLLKQRGKQLAHNVLDRTVQLASKFNKAPSSFSPRLPGAHRPPLGMGASSFAARLAAT